MAFKNKADATAYQNQFIAKNYDRITLILPKGKKELIQTHARGYGESTNRFINRAIDHELERDKAAQADSEGLTKEGEDA